MSAFLSRSLKHISGVCKRERSGFGVELGREKELKMARMRLSEDLRPLSDLKTQTSEIIQQAQASGRPVVLTRHGRGVAVLLSVEAFEDLQISAEALELQRAVDGAERDMAEGRWVEHSEVKAKLKRWAGET
jgi:prevent-host-death family protein